MLSQPDIAADVNIDGAIKCANTALHTAGRFRNNMPAGKNFAPAQLDRFFFVRHGHFLFGYYVMIHVNHLNNNMEREYFRKNDSR
jgi:hypothetical protein